MHKKGENENNMAESRDLETKRDQEGFRNRKVPPMPILLKSSKTKKVEGKMRKQ
jgi:hypothetical protein